MVAVHTIHTGEELRRELDRERDSGKTIGFVPTMGALHDGHRSLVIKALEENDVVVCSIFVNPTQFNDPNDLDKYPRTLEADLALLEEAGCQYAFVPSVKEMYPVGPVVLDLPFGPIENVMEGAFRPGHFRGMATVVDHLLRMVNANNAYFGEKDFQQLAIVRQLVVMRNIPTNIIGCPTLRESDGLAMSSRNMLLNSDQRKAAPLIYKALKMAQEFIPHHSPEGVKQLVIRYIEQSSLLRVQYFEICDQVTLEPLHDWQGRTAAQGCIAVLTEGPRLIDNISYRIHGLG